MSMRWNWCGWPRSSGRVGRGRALHLGLWHSLGGFRSRFCFSNALQDVADFFGDFQRNGARVCFLLGHTQARQKIDDGFCLDLQLAGQLVNSDLGCVTHASLRILLFLLTLRRILR